ncbi:MAG TPA: hypothetical protein DCP63_08770 [Bacteroidetes bacterium]|nr:hypothetical protein [Bacteroidota bacterium]
MKQLRSSVLFLLFTIAGAGAQASEFFNIVKVADGVYAAIAKPGVLCNGAFIVTNDGVIVVDTHLRPSWAKDLIREIKKLTDKPVRYVVNTHWHNDHTQGNKAYASVFPSYTEFISHDKTRDDIIGRAIPSITQNLKDLPNRLTQLRTQLESGKRADGTTLTDSMKMQLKQQIANQDAYLEELKTLEITIPTLTFDKSIVLWAGGREVQILYFGEGHTRGDVFVYLPKEKVLITGDMLTGGVPFMRDAVATAWASTLEAVGKLEFDSVIPGHGEVQKGKDRLNLCVRYLRDLVGAVKAQAEKGATLDEATRIVIEELAPTYEKEFQGFRQALSGPIGNVARTYEGVKRE